MCFCKIAFPFLHCEFTFSWISLDSSAFLPSKNSFPLRKALFARKLGIYLLAIPSFSGREPVSPLQKKEKLCPCNRLHCLFFGVVGILRVRVNSFGFLSGSTGFFVISADSWCCDLCLGFLHSLVLNPQGTGFYPSIHYRSNDEYSQLRQDSPLPKSKTAFLSQGSIIKETLEIYFDCMERISYKKSATASATGSTAYSLGFFL